MAAQDPRGDALVVERPAPGALVRHRRAALEVRPAARGPVAVEVRSGAAWLRATPAGPGLVLTHGASTVQVHDGAAVVEVHDFEALLVVIAGRAALKGSSALSRSITAGHAVTLTLDGTLSDPEPVAAAELATDRMVAENLALDALDSRAADPADAAADAEGRDDAATVTAPPPATAEATPPPEAPGATAPPAADLSPPARPRPAPGHPGAVDGPPPAAPPAAPSALESALVGVGVVDSPVDGSRGAAPAVAADPEGPAEAEGATAGASSRRRLLVVLVVAALIVVAVVVAYVLSGGGDDGAAPVLVSAWRGSGAPV